MEPTTRGNKAGGALKASFTVSHDPPYQQESGAHKSGT